MVDPSLYTQSNSYLSPGGIYLSVGPQPKGLSVSELCNLGKTVGSMFWPSVLGGVKAPFVLVNCSSKFLLNCALNMILCH